VSAVKASYKDGVAWDIYLFYPPQAVWADRPPEPTYWMHQLEDDWAKGKNYRTGEDLHAGLFWSMKKFEV
jgi:hypothetical protein